MSGAGRGGPRISPPFSADPLIPNLDLPTGQSASITSVGNGKWCYDLTIPSNAQLLTAVFADFLDGSGNSLFTFPKGGSRGLVVFEYNPAVADSMLEVELLYKSIVNSSGFVFSLPGPITLPAAGESLGGEVPIALPVFQTQSQGSTSVYQFGLPFCVPAGCPGGSGRGLTIRVREITSGAFGTANVQFVRVDNLGC